MTTESTTGEQPAAHQFYSHEIETELFCIAVSEILWDVSSATGLTERELLSILSRQNLDHLDALEALFEFPNNWQAAEKINAQRVVSVLRESITSVAYLAALNPNTIVRVLTRATSKTTEDFVLWLRSGNWRDVLSAS